MQAAIVDEAELGQLARLVARLIPGQQRFMVALADGFRGDGWSRSSGSAPGEAGASTEETTPADHPAVMALLSPGSLTASRSLRRHLARKV